MRDPSIHIKESDLRKILEEGLETKLFEVDIKYILRKAIKHTCNNRSVTITNDKLEKKIEKVLKSSSTDANTFNNILFMVRKKNKHFGFKKLEENNSRDWGVIKDSASLALDFSNEFGLDKKKGFIKYCEIAINMMTKFSYPKLKSMYDSICQTYHFEKEISLDPTPDNTKDIHDYYNNIILRQVGTGIDHSKNPSNYYYFIEVKKICKEKGVKYQDYIKAQFHGMGFRNGIPHPAQLVGDKALERLTTYMFEHEKKINKIEGTKRKGYLAAIKKLK